MSILNTIYTVLTDREIIAHYIGVPESTIDWLIGNKSNKIHNPLRNDNNPSLCMMEIKYNGRDKIKIKDYGDAIYNGDIFDFIGLILKIDSRSKDGFVAICNDIITRMIITNEDVNIIPTVSPKIKVNNATKEEKYVKVITRAWTSDELRFWHKVENDKNFTAVVFDHLNKEKVHIADRISINGYETYNYNPLDIAYVYYYNVDAVKGHIIKAYFPQRTIRGNLLHTTRFFTNDTEKYRELNHNNSDNKLLIMTKSMKDAIYIISFFSYWLTSESINVAYLQGESNMLSEYEFDALLTQYDSIIWLTDYDKTGIINAYYHSLYSDKIKPLFINGNNYSVPERDKSNTVNMINSLLGTTLDIEDFEAFENTFKYKHYFKGIKDFTDLLQNKSLKYIYKLFKVLTNDYIKEFKSIHGTNHR